MESFPTGEFFPEKYFKSDETFDALLTDPLRLVAPRHWTPLEVAEKAARFLCTHAGAKILDIGSGSGKFCFTAGYHHPEARFTGVEQREYLVDFCNRLKEKLGFGNVNFIHSNISDFDISEFDHFYFYNSFYENIPGTQKIDYDIKYSESLYNYYNRMLYKKLDKMPSGTRLVTYHSLGGEIPPGYEIVGTDYAEFLKYWQKL
ncbi:MAG: methyltransferase domain-containing protein [Chitinophagaceae bacterium]|nr:methyltransferase domain-containing protein [Chitinophagaceae bacterium]